jgi:hypothetical protein
MAVCFPELAAIEFDPVPDFQNVLGVIGLYTFAVTGAVPKPIGTEYHTGIVVTRRHSAALCGIGCGFQCGTLRHRLRQCAASTAAFNVCIQCGI